MDDVTLTAIAIVRGLQQGDEFVWDYEWVDEAGEWHYGQWKSVIEEERKRTQEQEDERRGPTEGR